MKTVLCPVIATFNGKTWFFITRLAEFQHKAIKQRTPVADMCVRQIVEIITNRMASELPLEKRMGILPLPFFMKVYVAVVTNVTLQSEEGLRHIMDGAGSEILKTFFISLENFTLP